MRRLAFGLGLLALACAPLPPPCMASAPAPQGTCSPRLTIEFRPDTAFSEAELDALAKAAALWETASGGVVRLELGTVGNEIHRGGVDIPGMVGETRGQEIWLDPTLAPGTFEAAAAHEFGHALGLKHSADEGSIMFASVRQCARLSAGDLEALARVLP